jgi:hypothetical protein
LFDEVVYILERMVYVVQRVCFYYINRLVGIEVPSQFTVSKHTAGAVNREQNGTGSFPEP